MAGQDQTLRLLIQLGVQGDQDALRAGFDEAIAREDRVANVTVSQPVLKITGAN